jgi:ribosomal protein S18 acetylase RimI-like enzyme
MMIKIYDKIEFLKLLMKKENYLFFEKLIQSDTKYKFETFLMNLIKKFNKKDLIYCGYEEEYKINNIINFGYIVINENIAYISTIRTRLDKRNQGKCKQFLKLICDDLQKRKYKKIELEVEIGNIGAIKCYEAIGFTKNKKPVVYQYGDKKEEYYKMFINKVL